MIPPKISGLNYFHAWVERWEIGPGMNDKGDRYTGLDGVVGIGWIPILDDLARDLYAMGWNGSLDQVKEKWGTLRFYTEGTLEMLERIELAEQQSAVTCEECGVPGEMRMGSWCRTLCDRCYSGSAYDQADGVLS